MHRSMLFLIPAFLAAAPAPQASSQDWNNWVYRANSILRAIAGGEKRDVDITCRDIYREMAVKGFPKWARELTGVCDALKDGLTNGTRGKFCSKARSAAAIIGTATPVSEEPRAEPLGRKLATAMNGLYQGMCK